MTNKKDDYFKSFESAIARIYVPDVESPNEGVVGAGVLISDQYVLTCTHVVTSALNIRLEEKPENLCLADFYYDIYLLIITELLSHEYFRFLAFYFHTLIQQRQNLFKPIDVDFPLIAAGQKLKAKVFFWKPFQFVTVTPSKEGEDIAVLKLEGELPKQAQPATINLIEEEDLLNNSLMVYGFPLKHPSGIWSHGVVSGKVAYGWVQVGDDKITGYRIQPGCSGSPVWDTKLACVVGVVVAAETEEEVKAAFMIPTKVLRKHIPNDFFSSSERKISVGIVDSRYRSIIDTFPSDTHNIVPFLGAGINLCDQSSGMIIKLTEKLAESYNCSGGLLGIPCSVCPLPLKDSWPPPENCPLRKRLETEQQTNNILTCPLSKEQKLALAKMNLRFLSQLISLEMGDDLYVVLHQHLDELYEDILQDKTNPYRLHKFFARLPRKLLEKEYRKLPYQLIVTTNYDEILERIFDQVGQPYDVIFYVAKDDNGKPTFKHKTYKGEIKSIDSNYKGRLPCWGEHPIILKLFGTWQHEFVITEEDYLNYLVHTPINQLLPAPIIEHIQESKILFLGYSLNDPDLQIVLHLIWQDNPLKYTRGISSWIVHQSKPGDLERRFCSERMIENIEESSIEDLVTNLEMGIEQLPIKK